MNSLSSGEADMQPQGKKTRQNPLKVLLLECKAFKGFYRFFILFCDFEHFWMVRQTSFIFFRADSVSPYKENIEDLSRLCILKNCNKTTFESLIFDDIRTLNGLIGSIWRATSKYA